MVGILGLHRCGVGWAAGVGIWPVQLLGRTDLGLMADVSWAKMLRMAEVGVNWTSVSEMDAPEG